MKLKQLFYGVGLRPRPREYPCELRRFTLPEDGAVDYAQWQHPSALRNPTVLDPAEVAGLRRYLQPGDVALDIGAHAGDSTVPIALSNRGRVRTLDPRPSRGAPPDRRARGLARDPVRAIITRSSSLARRRLRAHGAARVEGRVRSGAARVARV